MSSICDDREALDPQVAAFLEKLKEHGGRSVVDGTVEEARAMVRGFAKLMGPEPEMASVTDRTIPGPGGEIPIRIYRPDDGPLPVLVFLHGGGFALGDLEVTDIPCRHIAAAAPCVVVSVDYRLAPEHPFPAAPDDVYAAVSWAAEHREELSGGHTAPIAVGGDSAGGNLSAVVCLMARDRGGPEIGLQVLIYPSTEMDSDRPSHQQNASGYLLTQDEIDWFHARYVPTAEMVANPYASPLKASDHARLPPALVITAGYDPIRDDGEAYAKALQTAGVDVRLNQNPTMIHGFLWLGGFVDHVAGVYTLIGDEIRARLG